MPKSPTVRFHSSRPFGTAAKKLSPECEPAYPVLTDPLPARLWGRSLRWRIGKLVAGLAVALAWSCLSVPANAQAFLRENSELNAIRLKAETFIPKTGLDKRLRDYFERREARERIHVLVQFTRVPDLRERERLERIFNLTLLDPIPERAYFAGMPAKWPLAQELAGNRELVRWVGPILPAYKIAPWLPKDLPDWARPADGAAEVIVQFFGDVPVKEQRQLLNQHAAKLLTRIEPLNGWRVILKVAILKRLSAEDAVKWIEEVPPPPEDDNDSARSATATNADPVYPPAVYGVTGNGVVMAQWEPRHASLTHGDFAGRITLADPPLSPYERSYLHDESVAANNQYDNGEAIYRDVDDSATVSANDVRATVVGAFAAGSTVTGVDADVGTGLVFFGFFERFDDLVTVDFLYTAGEGIYNDADNTRTVTVGDTRLTPVGAFGAGSGVVAGDTDIGQVLRFFATNPHSHPTHVAGTAMGSGAQSAAAGGTANQWQGLGLGATLRSYAGSPISGTGAPVPADEYTDAAANNVAISTNSWGFSHCHQTFLPATCYDIGSQYYDSVISGRRSDGTASGIARQILIFGSAGNRGRPERHSEEVAVNGQFDNGESIYRDRNDDGLVDAGDELRLGAGVAAGSALVNFNLNEAHDDSVSVNSSGFSTIDVGEGIYVDADLSLTVTAGDTRTNVIVGFPAGSVVAAVDADVGTALRRFLLWGNVRRPNSAKGTIEVANIASDDTVPSPSSSRGPTDDGRVKPDLSGPGSQNSGDFGVTSTWPGNIYNSITGTSMSTPALAGVAALVEEWYQSACVAGGATPASLKALMIHSAQDLDNIPNVGAAFSGPDFSYGYGRARAKEALDLLPHHLQGTANVPGDTDLTVTVGTMGQLKVTLAWDDPAWVANAVPSAVTGILQNDLDLVLIDPTGVQYTPWEVNAANPFAPATRTMTPAAMPIPAAARDRRNPVEQVVVDNAMPGDWTIRVTASTLALPSQTYTLVSEVLPVQSGPCASAPAADVWLMDNPTDTGVEPSVGSMWLGPDPWNRLVEDGITTHENPEFGQTNYLYATLRNASAVDVAATTVGFWVASAALGLTWPANFEYVGQVAVPNMGPGEVRQIGPLAWNPPSPAPSSHFCMYVRVDSPQDPIPAEGPGIGSNSRNNNNIIYRNLTIVDLLSSQTVSFLVRNIDKEVQEVDVLLAVPEEFLKIGQVFVGLSPQLEKGWSKENRRVEGLLPPDPRLRVAGYDERTKKALHQERELGGVKPEIELLPPPHELKAPKVLLRGLRLEPGAAETMRLIFRSEQKTKAEYDIQVIEQIRGETVGGIQFLVRTGYGRQK